MSKRLMHFLPERYEKMHFLPERYEKINFLSAEERYEEVIQLVDEALKTEKEEMIQEELRYIRRVSDLLLHYDAKNKVRKVQVKSNE
jgi:hypothetical protein